MLLDVAPSNDECCILLGMMELKIPVLKNKVSHLQLNSKGIRQNLFCTELVRTKAVRVKLLVHTSKWTERYLSPLVNTGY